jgi:carbon storage regulator
MLVLSRKCNESIVIGGNIQVKVVAIAGCQIRLGIEAPREVSVVREELLTRQAQPPVKQPSTTPLVARRGPLAASGTR